MPHMRPTYPLQTATIHVEAALQSKSTTSSRATKVLWSTRKTPWSRAVHMTPCVHLHHMATHPCVCAFFPRCVLINRYSGFLEHHLFHCAPQPPLMDGENTLRLGVSSPVCVCLGEGQHYPHTFP